MTDDDDNNRQGGDARARRPRTQAEWDAVTGGLVEARTLAEAKGSDGVFRIDLCRYAKVPPYIRGAWWKPDAEGRLRKSRGRTIAVHLADVPAFVQAWAEAKAACEALPTDGGSAPPEGEQ